MVGAGYDGALKPQIFQGMQELFQRFGDGTERPDKSWGHRSVGNAILAFGEEGREVLKGWMHQTRDQRLAEMAWQILFFKEKGGDNRFNVISEKENEEAYKVRPPHMKRLPVEKISQNFDGEIPSAGSFGDAGKSVGRWSALGVKGQFLDKTAGASGKSSIKLARSGGVFLGRVIAGVSEGYAYEASVRIRRSDGGALTFSLLDPKRSESIALRVDATGNVAYWDPQSPTKWVNTDLTIPAKKWTELAIRANPIDSTCKIALDPNGDDSWTHALVAPLMPAGSVDRVALAAISDDPEEVRIDDVLLIERR
jgi:hypothetical protein